MPKLAIYDRWKISAKEDDQLYYEQYQFRERRKYEVDLCQDGNDKNSEKSKDALESPFLNGRYQHPKNKEDDNQATSVHQVKWARHWNQYDRLPPDTENGIETVLHTQTHDPTGFHIDDSRRIPCDLAKRYNGISCSIFFKPMLRNLGSSRVSSRELNLI